MNAEVVKGLVLRRTGRPPRRHSDADLARIGDPLLDPLLKTYLSECLPDEVVGASGMRLLPLSGIVEELERAPGWYLHSYDYVPIATSIGGNAVVVHAWGDRRAKVYWADHVSFSDGQISYQVRETGEWVYLDEYTPAHVELALVPLGGDLFRFVTELLLDKLTERLDALD